eukprot:1235540-Amphidinium_carterae.1
MAVRFSEALRQEMEERSVQMMPLRDIRCVKEFSGQDRDFESWSFVVESMFAELDGRSCGMSTGACNTQWSWTG